MSRETFCLFGCPAGMTKACGEFSIRLQVRLIEAVKIEKIAFSKTRRHQKQRTASCQLDRRNVLRVPRSALPRVRVVGSGVSDTRQPANRTRFASSRLSQRHRRHQVGTGRLRQNADRVVKVRSRAKSAVPPRVVGRVRRDAGDSSA